MDKVELKAYPFPAGMQIPRLMPYQEFPWNGDGFIAAEVLRLKGAHGLRDAIETGTCLGSTTCWLAENFDDVRTTEVSRNFSDIAINRLNLFGLKVNTSLGNDSAMLDMLRVGVADRSLVFLDAHWGPNCPLLNELDAIAKEQMHPCILIHDFQVPGTDFGYDRMPDGRPFNLDLISGHLDRIYGVGGWKHNYPTEVAGARRGWISIEPC